MRTVAAMTPQDPECPSCFKVIDASPTCSLICRAAPVAAVILPSGVIAHCCPEHLRELLAIGRLTYPLIEIVGCCAAPAPGEPRKADGEVAARRLRLVAATVAGG